jgi:hypothetical protein
MNENLQKLYDVLVRDGYYTKSYDEFQTKWSDEGYRQKVYGAVSRDGLYTKDYDSFTSKYSVVEPVEETPPVKKKDATASASGDGSSDSGKSRWASVIEEDETAKVAGGIQDHRELVEESGGVVPEQKDEIKFGPDLGAIGTPKELSEYFATEKPKVELSEEDKAINMVISQVDRALVGKEEEEVVPFMQNLFGDAPDKYKMFTFEESGAGDFMTIKNPLTNDEITISLDNWSLEKDNEEARILRGYLNLNMKFPEYSTTTYEWNRATKELEDIDPTDWQAYTDKSNEVKRLNAEREAILAKMRSTASTNKYFSYAISKMRGIKTLEFDASDLTVSALRLEEKKKEAQEFNDKVTSGDIDLSIPENVEFVNNRNDQYNKEIQKDTDILINKQTNLKNQAADIEEIAGGALEEP